MNVFLYLSDKSLIFSKSRSMMNFNVQRINDPVIGSETAPSKSSYQNIDKLVLWEEYP